jgi:hypothetical protein
MAEHVTPTAPTTDGKAHHGVRFERSDVEPRNVVVFAGALVVAVVVIALFLWGVFFLFEARDRVRKETDLPPAAVDRERLPPQPRLEELDDLRQGKTELWPQRGRNFLGPEEKRIEPSVNEAMTELAGKLPAKEGPSATPPNFLRRLPSRASAGRLETGGQ